MSFQLIPVALKTAFAAIGKIGAGVQAALAVGSTATSYLSAKGAAEAQNEANAQANERARQYMIEEYDQTSRMASQERAAATQRINQNQIEARKAAASAQVAATAGGVSGLSVNSLLADIYGQEASIRDSVNQNLENTGQQIAAERRGTRNRFTNTINTRPIAQKPSFLGATLDAATGVYGAYKDQLRVKSKLGGNR